MPLPDQFATMDTTLGQPVDWNRPAKIWSGVGGDVRDESERFCRESFQGLRP